MRVLVTARGSIAQRHARHLRDLIPALELAVVSGNGTVDASFGECKVVSDIAQGLAWPPQAVVIASISSRHAGELLLCLQAGLPCLVEKPLVITHSQLDDVKAAEELFAPMPVVVGCNLRYVPALQTLRAAIKASDGKIVRAQFEVGQDLAQWRPTRDVQASYSAHEEQGGGVVFDLVHEIDMALWLLGPLRVKAAVGGHFGHLPLAVDDVHVALLENISGAPVTISLDYVSKRPVRRYCIVTTRGTWDCDLMARRLTFSDEHGVQLLTENAADFDVANSYRFQMQDWLAALSQKDHALTSPLSDALASAALMLAIKKAATPI